MKLLKKFIIKYKFELIISLLSFIFSSWLMFSTFSYSDGFMQISTKAWSDFASHIPLIRSFSFGNNIPPQYPLFSGPPIKYHFLFYAFVGLLEKCGLRIDFALNIPSIIGFSFLILMVYVFSLYLFKSKAVGLLSIIFLLFNSSLDFINFFKMHPLSLNLFHSILINKDFPSFGPYDGRIISAFWNLNIYTNQRHLAFSYALSLLLILLILKKYKKANQYLVISLLTGVVLGISFLLNIAVFLMTICVFIFLAILFKEKRKYIFISVAFSSLIALPQYMFIQSYPSLFKPIIHFGYLVEKINPLTFIDYWFQNIGLNLFIIPLGFLIATKGNRKILLSFFALFIVGNIIQFSTEIAANHKFFNYFIIIGGMFSAFFLVSIWKKNLKFKIITLLLIILLTLSGIIDFFPIYNDSKISLADYPVNKDISWIMNNTPKDAVFLNTSYLYDNASLAGRKIFLGWPYFAWSQGYDTTTRDNLRISLLKTNDFKFFCDNIIKYKISYTEINKSLDDQSINIGFLKKSFDEVYQNSSNQYFVFNLNKCQ